jgi:hypothetical protein
MLIGTTPDWKVMQHEVGDWKDPVIAARVVSEPQVYAAKLGMIAIICSCVLWKMYCEGWLTILSVAIEVLAVR